MSCRENEFVERQKNANIIVQFFEGSQKRAERVFKCIKYMDTYGLRGEKIIVRSKRGAGKEATVGHL